MKLTLASLFALLLHLGMPAVAYSDNAFARQIGILSASKNEGELIEQFAELAAQGDVNGAMGLLTPAIRGREAIVERDFRERVFPFFKDYSAVHNAKTIGSSVFPDGSRGTTHYGHIVTRTGERKPFMISFRKERGESVILSIDTDRCVPNRHPSCDSQDSEDSN